MNPKRQTKDKYRRCNSRVNFVVVWTNPSIDVGFKTDMGCGHSMNRLHDLELNFTRRNLISWWCGCDAIKQQTSRSWMYLNTRRIQSNVICFIILGAAVV